MHRLFKVGRCGSVFRETNLQFEISINRITVIQSPQFRGRGAPRQAIVRIVGALRWCLCKCIPCARVRVAGRRSICWRSQVRSRRAKRTIEKELDLLPSRVNIALKPLGSVLIVQHRSVVRVVSSTRRSRRDERVVRRLTRNAHGRLVLHTVLAWHKCILGHVDGHRRVVELVFFQLAHHSYWFAVQQI